jgi:hypothetical protein
MSRMMSVLIVSSRELRSGTGAAGASGVVIGIGSTGTTAGGDLGSGVVGVSICLAFLGSLGMDQKQLA